MHHPPDYDQYIHKTVLLKESMDGLALMPGDIYLDGTLGSGGHAQYVADTIPDSIIIGLDRDFAALARAKERLAKTVEAARRIFLIQEDYRNLDKALDTIGIPQVNRIMLDLGLSSDQFETSGRGFSFRKDEPLLMTFADEPEKIPQLPHLPQLTAYDIVNTWDEENIADIIYGYGEETYARKIARAIAESRSVQPIRTTFELVEIIKKGIPSRHHHGRTHPATKTFQALRITVNDEINALKEGLRKGFERLAPGGRMAVISFHSIEDRIVKNFYKEKATSGECTAARIITKKPIIPSDEEIELNPRSRSAKLRIIEKI